MEERRRPERSCVGCGARGEKRAFLRVIRGMDGIVRVDESGRGQGRGAYLCRKPSCVEAARKKRSLSRALKAEVPGAVYDELLERMKG